MKTPAHKNRKLTFYGKVLSKDLVKYVRASSLLKEWFSATATPNFSSIFSFVAKMDPFFCLREIPKDAIHFLCPCYTFTTIPSTGLTCKRSPLLLFPVYHVPSLKTSSLFQARKTKPASGLRKETAMSRKVELHPEFQEILHPFRRNAAGPASSPS